MKRPRSQGSVRARTWIFRSPKRRRARRATARESRVPWSLRVEPRETSIAIGERCLEQLDSLALSGRQLVESQPIPGELERRMGDVDADDAFERRVGDERTKELAVSAAEVEHALRAAGPDCGDDCTVPLLIQPQGLLDGLLLSLPLLDIGVDARVLVGEELLECGSGQRSLI